MNFPDKDLDKMLLFADFTIEHAAEEIFWVDSNARIQRVNEAACRKLGYSR